jgi:hypothetical protein
MALQDTVRRLLPRSEHLYGFLERQATATRAAAQALSRLAPGLALDEVLDELQTQEERSHSALHELEDALRSTFVSPIDRDDLQHLAGDLHRVVVLTGSSARHFQMFGLAQPTRPMTELIAILGHCTAQLADMVPALHRHDYASLMSTSRELRKEVKRAQVVSRSGLAALFHDEKDPKSILREMRIVEHLGHTIDRCERVAHRLAHVAVKHG